MGNWSTEEIGILKKEYPIEGNSIDELLKNRPINSIRYRTKRLNILSPPPPPRIKCPVCPTVSFRLKKEEKDRLNEISFISGKSVPQLIREKILDANCWSEKK